jgi:pimeloyl-ACP methyl ester carboxylesterase
MTHSATSVKGLEWDAPGRGRRWLTLSIGSLQFVLAVSSMGALSHHGDTGLQVEEFAVRSENASIAVRLISPPAERLSSEPVLLLYFSADRRSSMPDGRYGAPTRVFLENGHRVASFDLPAHGERVGRHGSGIAGFAAMVAAGEDPFAMLVADGRAVIDECIRRGLASEGNVVVAGVSRGGYCALRLAAADSRISAVAGLSPVTDWREIDEFERIKDTPAVGNLALERFARDLAGRRVYVAIGNRDTRVGTHACTRFVLALLKEESRLGGPSQIRYHIADDSRGHALAGRWRIEGIEFLMSSTVPDSAQPLP